MQDLQPRPATYDDLLAAPPHMVAEIIHGHLVTHPRPAPRQTTAASRLGAILSRSFEDELGGIPGGWRIVDEPELHLGAEVLVPDLAGWRLERMPELPETAWFETVPNWVCEVLSPSTEKYDRGAKRDIYAATGVRHLWHVDVRTRMLEVFELVGGRWVLFRSFQDDEPVAAPPFDAVPFELRLLWSR